MHIHDLPDEVLELILDYIEPWELRRGVAGACRRWAALARRRAPAVRSARGLRDLGRTRGMRALLVPAGLAAFHVPTLLTRAAQLAPRLAALTLHAGVRLSTKDFTIIHHLLPHLRHLDVFPAPTASTPSVLPRLRSLVFNQHTVHLNSSQCRLRALHMYGESQSFPARLVVLRAGRERLTELTLRCPTMPDRAFEAVGDCVNLETLQLYSCWLMRAAGAAAATRPARLRRLHVTGARLVRRAALATALATLPPGLEELVLSGGWLGDEHVPALAARVPRLAVLEAWGCPLSAAGVLRLAAALPRLRVLDLDRALTATHVAALTRHPALEFLRCLPGDPKNDADLELKTKEFPRTKDEAISDPSDDAMLVGENLLNEESPEPTETKDEAERSPSRPGGAGDTTSQERDARAEEEALAALAALGDGGGGARAVRVESAAAAFADDYFRAGGAGFRGRLFYYWTPPLQLRHKHAPLRDGDFDF